MKTILLTGGNRGIGLEICRQLALKGHAVILCSRNLEMGREAIINLKGNIHLRQADVTDNKSIETLCNEVSDSFGKIDVLINNAAIGEISGEQKASSVYGVKDFIESHLTIVGKAIRKMSPLMRSTGILPQKTNITNVSEAHFKKVMETNFYGAFRMVQAFIPLLEKSKDGRIINVSSGNGQTTNLPIDYPAYSLSKALLNSYTIMLSKALQKKNIKVFAMCPGWVKTDMGGPLAQREVSEGADTAVWLATENNIESGSFYRDRKVIHW